MPYIVDWLLDSDPWVRYRTRVDLLGEGEESTGVGSDYAAMLGHPGISALIEELSGWPVRHLSGHKEAGHPIHKLSFLAEVGLDRREPRIAALAARVMEHRSDDGLFQVLLNIPTRYGGTGRDQWAWALCDAPLLLYALVRFGYAEDPHVRACASRLADLVRANGWPCTGDIGKWRGPGRKDDPCPYANLAMLKALARMPELSESEAARAGAEALLTLWEQRRERHPYMFFMGTDFCKLKAPLVWYDILHVLDVLTQFVWLRGDPRLREIAALVRAKADGSGRYTPESAWKAWADWEFGQKRNPSPWLTLLVSRALHRLDL